MLLSLHGQSKDALAKTQLGAWEYDIVMPGYKCNMTDIMAAIGLAQMQRYPGAACQKKADHHPLRSGDGHPAGLATSAITARTLPPAGTCIWCG